MSAERWLESGRLRAGRSHTESVGLVQRQGVIVFFKLLFTSAVCFFIFVIGTSVVMLPDLEHSREESREAQAYILSKQIRSCAVPAGTKDPWGSHFIVKHIGEDGTVVVSCGRNMMTPEKGFDSDDIWDSMSDPPHRQALRRKRTQLLLVCIVAALPWRYLAVTLLRERRRWNTTGAGCDAT